MTRATITILLFSGRRNPAWVLRGQAAERLRAELHRLPPAPAAGPEPPGLGYGGFRVDFDADDDGIETWRFYAGVATRGGAPYLDARRAIERRLLESDGGVLDRTLKDLVRRQTGGGGG